MNLQAIAQHHPVQKDAIATETAPEADAAGQSHEAFRRTIHDLCAHQFELETQNEELRRTQAELEALRTRYVEFYDLAPVGYLSVGENNQILQANLAIARLLFVTRNTLIAQPFTRFIVNDDQDTFYLLRRRMVANGAVSSCELRLRKRDGTFVWTKIQAIIVSVQASQPILRMVIIDISERKQAEARLRAQEKLRDAILDAMPSQIVVLDRSGVILAVNQTWRRMAQEHSAHPAAFDHNANIGVNYLSVCQRANEADPSGDAARARDGILDVINRVQPSFYLEYPCFAPSSQRWFVLSVTPLDLQDQSVVVTHTDITERRQLQEAKLAHAVEVGLATSRQRLRELVALKEAALEEERKHMAREVHDELGQVLTALRMKLSLLGMRCGGLDPTLSAEVQDMKTLVDRAIQGVRNVASQLRPVALDMGLVPAIGWLCQNFTSLTGLPCKLDAPDNLDLDKTRAIVVFRIVQESLTNITRYACASQVHVVLRHCRQDLSLQVSDNGCGFDTGQVDPKKSFGLLGMRERAIALGGQLTIASSPGQGTLVDLSIPVVADPPEVSA